jgi:hypothetical protein
MNKMENTQTTIHVDLANRTSNFKPMQQRTPIKSPLQQASI